MPFQKWREGELEKTALIYRIIFGKIKEFVIDCHTNDEMTLSLFPCPISLKWMHAC